MKIQVQFIESQTMIQKEGKNKVKTQCNLEYRNTTENNFSNQRHKPHKKYTGGNEPKIHTAEGNGTIISARGDGNWSPE